MVLMLRRRQSSNSHGNWWAAMGCVHITTRLRVRVMVLMVLPGRGCFWICRFDVFFNFLFERRDVSLIYFVSGCDPSCLYMIIRALQLPNVFKYNNRIIATVYDRYWNF